MNSVELSEYERLRRKVEQYKSSYDRAKGAFNHSMSLLESEFGCKTVKDAQKLLKLKRKEAENARLRLRKTLDDFKRKYGTVLTGEED